ncbi:MAG: NACHT domain-containing protein [Pseudonocardiaceae bacterium]
MRWRWTPKRVRIAWGVVLLAAVVVFVVVKDPDEVVRWTSILGFFVALISLLASIMPRAPQPGPGLTQRLNQTAEDLAAAVEQQWRAEEKLRRVQDPYPLPVRWTAADTVVIDHWATVKQAAPGQEVANLSGQLDHVVDVFTRAPSGRLVVLGKPGAGKTVLTLRFTLDLLERRQPQDRVPVIFPLASWHPEQQILHEWMSERLTADYPALGALTPSGSTWAWELVCTGRLLPVLDGLDEIPEPLRGEAMHHLNRALDHDVPVMLTSRTDEYRDLVETAGVFAGAAVVELLPLDLDDLADYLPRTIHQARRGGTDPTTKWEPVLASLRENADQPATQAAVEVLCTPLMTSMASIAYSDTSADPTHLLDDRFADPAALEQHLLDTFIPAAYYHPTPPATMSASARVRYRPEQAREWLRFIARHLNRLGTRDLAWWQYVHAVPRLMRGFLVGVTLGLATGLLGMLAAGPVVGLVYGLTFGLASGFVTRLGWPQEPARVEMRFRGTMRPFFGRFAVGLVTGFVVGFAFDLPYVVTLGLGLVFGIAIGLRVWLDTPADVARAASPPIALSQDRIATLVLGLTFGLMLGLGSGIVIVRGARRIPPWLLFELPFGLIYGLPAGLAGAVGGAVAGSIVYKRMGGIAFGLAGTIAGLVIPPVDAVFGLMFGLVFGLATGSLAMLAKAWGAFVLSRMWLAVRGHQPWRLMEFLADAHRRGVLRQVGGVYQFRHARLQDHLAGPDPRPAANLL